jgi:hypothetical protein
MAIVAARDLDEIATALHLRIGFLFLLRGGGKRYKEGA